MDDVKSKQQIIDKIKEATNILVTVSNDPSVDALSAALGLSLLIDKMDKHATAVFSGKTPPAIEFLEPDKTFEDSTDSLRDFIIALDKDKADHLRVKPEGDVVKIYVTPYRTTISPDDLSFSQGDFNVELVIAIGVDVQEHLDGALDSHGKILHDAPIISISAGEQVSNIGTIDWHDDKASSLSEMVASLADGLKKDKSFLDKQAATAFLTGIVAATDRFSNPRTTSKAMTVAATLMAAGADQQLIASKLEEGEEEDEPTPVVEAPIKIDKIKPEEDGEVLNIAHVPHSEAGETLEEMDHRVKAEEQRLAAEEANRELRERMPEEAAPTPEPEPVTIPEPAPVVASAYAPVDPAPTLPPIETIGDVHGGGLSAATNEEPAFGGVLNATADQAEDDNRKDLASDQNKVTLSHAYMGGAPADAPLINGAETDQDTFVDPFTPPPGGGEVHSAYALEEHPPLVVPAPADLGLPMPPPLPDFAPEPASIAPVYGLDTPSVPPAILGEILSEPQTPVTSVPSVGPNDPSQFKIPGQ